MAIDWPDDKVIERWYCQEGMSQAAIARRIECDPSCISRKIAEMDIESRGKFKQWPEPETVRKWYWDEGLSTTEIAERLGRGSSSVQVFMSRHDIPRRSRFVEWPSSDTLRQWHWVDGMTREEIAEKVGCSSAAVYHKFRREGIEFRGHTAYEPDTSEQRFVMYTRWAVGETQREFGSRLGVSHTTVRMWETGEGGVGWDSEGVWLKLVALGKRHGISPDSPRRHMYWRQFLDVLGELLYELDCTQQKLADLIGVTEQTVSGWRTETHRPHLRHHKAVRDLAELHGVWSPSKPIEDEAPDVEPEPDPDLSEQDVMTIATLHEGGTNPSDLAMMYDIPLSMVSDIIRDRDD